MTKTEIRELILTSILEIAPGVNVVSLDDTTPFREQLDLDSMDFLDLVMDLRKHHRIEIPKEDFPQIKTMNDFIHYLGPKLRQLAA